MSGLNGIRFEGVLCTNRENDQFIYRVSAFSARTGKPLQEPFQCGPFDSAKEAELAGEALIDQAIAHFKAIFEDVKVTRTEETIH